MESKDLVGQRVSEGVVVPEWIDVNGHMNVAYYLLAFDRAVDDLWARLGITEDYIESTRGSTFAVESHVTWQRELQEADPYIITSQLVAYDAKRIHQFQRMYHGEKLYLAATAEWLNLHVDLEARRVSPWPADILDNLAECMAQHRQLPVPAELGKRMRVREPLGQVEGYAGA